MDLRQSIILLRTCPRKTRALNQNFGVGYLCIFKVRFIPTNSRRLPPPPPLQAGFLFLPKTIPPLTEAGGKSRFRFFMNLITCTWIPIPKLTIHSNSKTSKNMNYAIGQAYYPLLPSHLGLDVGTDYNKEVSKKRLHNKGLNGQRSPGG